MNSLVLFLLMAGQQGAEGAPNSPFGSLGAILPFVAIIAIFYFLILRPQNKKQKETQKMLAALKKRRPDCHYWGHTRDYSNRKGTIGHCES